MPDAVALPVRQLGAIDTQITRVGLGSWAVGGDRGRQDDKGPTAAFRIGAWHLS